jgi:hypothetical protein
MHLVDDERLQRYVRTHVALPVERVIDHDALGNHRGVVSRVERQVGVGGARVVRQQQVVRVAHRSRERPGIGIDQELVLVEAQALGGTMVTAHLVGIQLGRPDVLHQRVPDVLRALVEADDVGGVLVRRIEQEQEDLVRVHRVEREVDARDREGRTQGVRQPAFDGLGRPMLQHVRHRRSASYTAGVALSPHRLPPDGGSATSRPCTSSW